MFRLLIAVIGVASLVSCGAPNERFGEQMDLGQHYYTNAKYEDSVERFRDAIGLAESEKEKYQATLGLATACAEFGHVLFDQAEGLLLARNRDASEKTWARGNQYHDDANKAFALLLRMRPDDTMGNYYLGLMFFKRACSLNEHFPIPNTKVGIVQKRRERDEAVKQFRIVLARESDDITKPDHGPNCKSPEAHRYVALALFGRSDWDRNDAEQARMHLTVYLNYVTWMRKVVDRRPQSDPKEKKEKERDMERLRQELSSTHDLLKVQLAGLPELVQFWEARMNAANLMNEAKHDPSAHSQEEIAKAFALLEQSDDPIPTKDQFEKRRMAVTREMAALSALKSDFETAAKEKPKGGIPQ